MLLVTPELLEWVLDTLWTPWELYEKIKSIQLELIGDAMPEYLKPALQWRLRVMKIFSNTALDPLVVLTKSSLRYPTRLLASIPTWDFFTQATLQKCSNV